MSDEAALLDLFGASGVAALTTQKRDGRPQLSNISYALDQGSRTFRISITDSRAKTKNLRRDPRASLYTTSADRWAYAVAEGTAELSPVATDPQDETVESLVALYRSISGQDHPDWDEYRRAMVGDERILLTVRIDHLYGMAR